MSWKKKLNRLVAWWDKIAARHPFLALAQNLTERFFDHGVGQAAAALAYYLIFTFFPFLVFLSMLLGFLQIPPVNVASELHRFLPADIIGLINLFLEHITEVRSTTILIFGLVFTVYSAMRAVDCLMRGVNRAYGITTGRGPIVHQIIVFCYTLFMMTSIFISLLLITVGRGLLTFAAKYFPISSTFITLWNSLRFVILAAIFFICLTLLYGLSFNNMPPLRHLYTGAIASLAAWLVFSAGFAFYVENLGRYSLLYGSIGAVIVLLLWLYLSATMLLMGAEVNAALDQRRH